MRKIIVAVLIALCICSTAHAGFWNPSAQGMTKPMQVFESINLTGDDKNTAVPSTNITAGTVIYGFSLVPYYVTSNMDTKVGLHDTVTDTGITYQECVAEQEVLSGVTACWFTYPITIKTSLQVCQGSNTIVYIYYGR